ncbi:DsbA family protein [Lysobacter sp. HA18]
MPGRDPAKRTFTYRHVTWRAQQEGIALNFPRAHPFNPLPALRLCVAAGTTEVAIDTVFRYLWEEGNAIEPEQEVNALACRLGLVDAGAALADPATKLALRANFAQAIEDGVFGVPTLVCDGHVFWGDDATGMFVAYQRDPRIFAAGAFARVANLPIGQARRTG